MGPIAGGGLEGGGGMRGDMHGVPGWSRHARGASMGSRGEGASMGWPTMGRWAELVTMGRAVMACL